MSTARFVGISGAIILIQILGGGADTAIQNYLIYEAGILEYGQIRGYLYAGCIGGFVNVVISFALKLWLFWGNSWQLATVAKKYGVLRYWLALIGAAICYIPLVAGLPFWLTSASSFIFSVIVIVRKAPKIFGEKT